VKSMLVRLLLSTLLVSSDFLEPNAFPNASTAYHDASSSGFLVFSLFSSLPCLRRVDEGKIFLLLGIIFNDGNTTDNVLVAGGEVGVKDVHGEATARKARRARIIGAIDPWFVILIVAAIEDIAP